MSLADRLQHAKAERKGPRCSVAKLMDRMPAQDREALQAALDDDQLEARAIWRALLAEGYDITDQPLGRHRRGICQCSRIDSQN